MNNDILDNALRFIGLLFLQVLVLQRITFGEGFFVSTQIILYPIFILLLPLRIPRPLVIFLGFLLGLGVDMFYDSPGIHASAATFTAFMRPYILRGLSPNGGYNINHSPTKKRYGLLWFVRYGGIMMALHLFFYFSVEVFTFVYLGEIILRTISSFIVSMFFVILYQFIFDPE